MYFIFDSGSMNFLFLDFVDTKMFSLDIVSVLKKQIVLIQM